MVHYENITKQSIFGAVKTVLDDPRWGLRVTFLTLMLYKFLN
jgi:hypothetical protein